MKDQKTLMNQLLREVRESSEGRVAVMTAEFDEKVAAEVAYQKRATDAINGLADKKDGAIAEAKEVVFDKSFGIPVYSNTSSPREEDVFYDAQESFDAEPTAGKKAAGVKRKSGDDETKPAAKKGRGEIKVVTVGEEDSSDEEDEPQPAKKVAAPKKAPAKKAAATKSAEKVAPVGETVKPAASKMATSTKSASKKVSAGMQRGFLLPKTRSSTRKSASAESSSDKENVENANKAEITDKAKAKAESDQRGLLFAAMENGRKPAANSAAKKPEEAGKPPKGKETPPTPPLSAKQAAIQEARMKVANGYGKKEAEKLQARKAARELRATRRSDEEEDRKPAANAAKGPRRSARNK